MLQIILYSIFTLVYLVFIGVGVKEIRKEQDVRNKVLWLLFTFCSICLVAMSILRILALKG